MKIIKRSNHCNVPDMLVRKVITKEIGELVVEVLNRRWAGSLYFYLLVEDDYKKGVQI